MYKKPKHNAVLTSFVGFLFGFDTVVISGSNLPIKELWNTSEWFHGFFIMSVALWGTLIGSAFGNIPCDRTGRKNTLFFIDENFPNMRRAKGHPFCFFVNWTLVALITFMGMVINGSFELTSIFSCFLVFALLQLFFVLFLMPEATKLTLEELQLKIKYKKLSTYVNPICRIFSGRLIQTITNNLNP
jgi:MFS family permease